MKVTVLVMVVAVLVSSTVKCDEASEELCEQIRFNKLRILTMGARGRSLDDAHFYILVEGGYMFKVPLLNLRVDAENKTTSITIDRDIIRADALFNVSRDLFTRQDRFFLISNQNQDAFLGRMFFSLEDRQTAFQLYDLSGAPSIRNHSHDIYEKYHQTIHVISSIGIDSNTTYGLALFQNQFIRWYSFEADYENKLKLTEYSPNWKKTIMEFSSTTDIVAVFYHQENPKKEDGYYYFLDANGLVTVCPRQNVWNYSDERFEVNLSSFVVCDFKKATNSLGIDSTYWIIALCIGALVGLGGVAIYFYCSLKKEKAKRKDLKKKYDRQNLSSSSFASSNLSSSNLNSSSISSGTSSSNASSNAFTLTSNPTTSSSSLASKGSSVLQSVKSSITSLLNRNKSKQAKTAAKAKNSKAKSKKSKSPK